MRVLGIIPARGGSKGIPGKNSKLLNGKPLISYTIKSAVEANLLEKIIVSSEDDSILQIAKDNGVDTIKRPFELATDNSPTILTVIHALNFFKKSNIEFDAVCLLQPTSPFRKKEFIDKAVEKFTVAKVDSLISVVQVPHSYNPHWVFEEDKNKNLKISTGESEIISRRQELPKAFIRDGAIYLTKSEVIINQKSLYGKSISYLESNNCYNINIDTTEDWERAENLLTIKDI